MYPRRKLSAADAARLLDSLLSVLLASANLDARDGDWQPHQGQQIVKVKQLVEALQQGCASGGCEPSAIAAASGALAALLLEDWRGRHGFGSSYGGGGSDRGDRGSGSGTSERGGPAGVPAADRLASWLHVLLFSQVGQTRQPCSAWPQRFCLSVGGIAPS